MWYHVNILSGNNHMIVGIYLHLVKKNHDHICIR